MLVGLGRAPLDDPGEGMHAAIARELLQSGDPFALTLGGVAYVDKPPLLYALLAGVFAVAGPGEAAARSVPAVAALAAVAATAWLGARLLGGAGGLVAGLALTTSAGFFAYARYVRPETLFVAALAWGFALVLVGLVDGRRGLVAGGLAAFGVAALAKDPLGALAPPLALAAALALAGRARPLARWLPWPGVVAGLGLAFAWWVAVEVRTPGFAWYTVVDNHLLNVVRARRFPDEDVSLGAGAFLAVALLGAVPWVVAAGAALWSMVRSRAWRDPAETPWVTLALWAIGVLGGTLLSGFRLPHYGLPAYPALALLAARGWSRGGRRLIGAHAALFAALALGAALAWSSDGRAFERVVLGSTDVAARKSAALGQAPPVPDWAELRPLVGATALVFGAAALATATAAATRGGRPALGALLVIATMIAMLPSVARGLELVAAHRSVGELARELARRAGPEDIVVHEGPLENSGALEWYGAPRPAIVDGRRSVLAFGATRPAAEAVFWDEARLWRAWESGRRVWVVSVRPPARSAVAGLPGARRVVAAAGRSLWTNAPEADALR